MKKPKRMMAGKKILVFCSVISILSAAFSVSTYAAKKDSVDAKTIQSSGITIDGYYDDWEDKPMSMLTWNENNGTAHHDVSLLKDDNYIYIYVKLHPSTNKTMPVDAIYLSINNKEYQLFVRYANAKNTVDWGHQINLSKNGKITGLHPFTYYPDNSLGDAAITVSKGNPNDRMEIRINIKDLEKVMNLTEGTINNGSQIKLSMPNVGGGTVELLGTSTGSVIGILLCIGAVLVIKWRTDKKSRLAQ